MSSETTVPNKGLGVRLLWFAALWASSVVVVGLVAFALRLWLKA